MNALAHAAEPCPNCGEPLPKSARFCPSCGAQVESGSTIREEVPPNETGQVPVTIERVEPRWYGMTPPNLLLGLATIALVLALVLFATGHWPYGLIILGVAALLLAAFLEAARRRPSSALSRASIDARERARTSIETLRVRQQAAAEARRIQNALFLVESDRRTALHDLGLAAHGGDDEAEKAARGRLSELDAREEALRRQLDEALEDAGERIRKAQLPVQETMMVLPQEPSPPPDEGTPPTPAVVPEPYPPPDEGDPPEPARVPEPSPRENGE